MTGVPQEMIDAAANYLAGIGVRPVDHAEKFARGLLAEALAAAPTEPAGLLVTAPGGDEWFDRRAVDVALAEQVAGHEQIRRKVVPLWVHPPVPDGETARLREAMEFALARISEHASECPPEQCLHAAIDELTAALSVGDTTGDEAKCESCGLRPALCLCDGRPAGVSSSTPGPDPEMRRIAVAVLLPAAGDERDALVEVMQDAIFDAFDIDSGAKEFAIAAYEALRDTPVGGAPANTTEEQG